MFKEQFGFTKVHYRGLAKNTAQIVTLFRAKTLAVPRWTCDDTAPTYWQA